MTPEETIRRAEHASQLLEDPLVIEALSILEREVIEQWEACPARDVEAREFLWKFYKTTKKFRAILQGVLESGKIAAHAIQQKKSFVENTLNVVRGKNR